MGRSILAGFGAGTAFAAAVLVAVSLALPPPPERGPTPRIVAAAPPAEPAAVEPAAEATPGPSQGRTPDPAPQRQADADGGPDVAAPAPGPVPGRSATTPGVTQAAPGESVAVDAQAADAAPEVASAALPSPAAPSSDDGLSAAPPPAAATTGAPAASSAGRVAAVEPGDAEARLPSAAVEERAGGAASREAGRQTATSAEGAPPAPVVPAVPRGRITAADAPEAERAARPGDTTGSGAAMEGRTAPGDVASAPRPEGQPAETSPGSTGTDDATVAANRAAPDDARPATVSASGPAPVSAPGPAPGPASRPTAGEEAGASDLQRRTAAAGPPAYTLSGLAQERAARADGIVQAGRATARPASAQPARGERIAALAPEAGAVPPAKDRPSALPVVRRPGDDAAENSSLLAAPPEDGGARRLAPPTRQAAGPQRAAPAPAQMAERVAPGEPGRPRGHASDRGLASDVVSGAEVARRLLSGPDPTAAVRPMPRQPRAPGVPPGRAPGVAATVASASPGGSIARRLAAGPGAGAGAGGERGIGLVRAAYVPSTGPSRRLAVARIRAEAVASAGGLPRAPATADLGAPAPEMRRAGEAPAVVPGPADVPVARPAGEELPLPDGYEAMRPTPDAPDTRLAQAPVPDGRRAPPGDGGASGARQEGEAGPDMPEPGAGSDAAPAPDAGRGEGAGAGQAAGADRGGDDAMPTAEAEAEDRAARPSVRILRPAPPPDGESAAPRLPGSGSIAPIIGSGEAAPADAVEGQGTSAAVEPGAGGGLARNAMPFDAAEGRPLLGIVLRHVEGLSPSTVAALGLPLTVALDPDATNAAEIAEAYRAAGLEVILAGLGLPAGATPQDVEVTVAARLSAFPGVIGVMDAAEGGFAGDTAQAAQVGGILAESGHGLLLWDEGLNSGLGAAREAGAIAGLVWRGIDRDGMSAPAIGRRIDRAVFEAARTGAVVVVADGRSETLEALATFAAEAGQARAAPAPVSAVLLQGE
ncbi:hypothetical protein DLJ49_09930 [Rhodovulum sp. 12E13]|uniref:divergent polysaccharide deacetylase family protein n=1 Tax=Rhodovulum sp. 12E13 TaxID=2203891 RepID=UPI000E11F346|nr:divergent polysaccharide deacetylase family protein [Rhodovulum sp. 12E13]RDC72537.1 hypothetical protein DLJ49_09930 [Rhodovulum sp. 12E13]